MEKELELLKEVTQLFAPSGYEDEVRNYLIKKYKEMGYETLVDPFGNTFALKKSKKENAKKVLLIGHMDEVGFMVKKILSNGNILVMPLGGFNSETILASRAVLKTFNNKKFLGAVSAIPPHLLKGASNEKTKIDAMVFDFGFTSYQDAIDHGVEIANPIVLDGKFEVLSSKRMLSKAFDDRIGIALGLEALNYFKDKELDYDLYVGGVLQEEVGLRGSLCGTHFIKPDFALVADCSTALDTSGNESEFGQLGKGVLLRVLDPSMIARKEIIKFQKECFDKDNIKYQYFISFGSTDAGNVHKSLDGVPTLSYCLVARNIHTCSSILDIDDYKNYINGIYSILSNLTEEKIKEFRFENLNN